MIVDLNTEKLVTASCYNQFAKDDHIWKKIQKEAEAATRKAADPKVK